MTLQVDVDDAVPLLLGHVDENAVPQDAGVVDEDVEIAEGFDGGVDEPLAALPVAHVIGIGQSLAAHLLDLVDDLLRRAAVVTRPVDGAAEVVHDDLGALAGKEQRVLAADAATGAGDDGRLVRPMRP